MASSQRPITGPAPTDEIVTPYDEDHFEVYLRLLDAAASGASDSEMCQRILGIESQSDPDGARRLLESHLARARWMSAQGYKGLLSRQ